MVQKEVESSIEQHAGKLGSEARLEEERRRKKVVCVCVQTQICLHLISAPMKICPLPPTHPFQEEIHKFLQSQDLNMAFELALSTSDLLLVMYLCQKVTPEEVFDKNPCPLSQPVLLSLIQQLSVNLNDQIELKTRYTCQPHSQDIATAPGNEATVWTEMLHFDIV